MKVYFSTDTNESHVLDFVEVIDHIPPLIRLDTSWKLVISLLLLTFLALGLRYRLLILSYLNSPQNENGPIDLLIWFDQLFCGICGALAIALHILMLNLSFPLASFTGPTVCRLLTLPANLYISGMNVWSSILALYRVTFVLGILRSHHYWCLSLGILIMIILNYLIMISDRTPVLEMNCLHMSKEVRQIMMDYENALTQVNQTYGLTYMLAAILVTMNLIEFISYATFFVYIFTHNQTMRLTILSDDAIRKRRRTHGISLFGQFLSWLLETWYIFAVVLLIRGKVTMGREIAIILELIGYGILPIFQVYTSPPIRRFIAN